MIQISKCTTITFSNLKSFVILKLLWQEIGNYVGMNSKPTQSSLLNRNSLHGDSRMSISVERNGGYSENSTKWKEIQISKRGI